MRIISSEISPTMKSARFPGVHSPRKVARIVPPAQPPARSRNPRFRSPRTPAQTSRTLSPIVEHAPIKPEVAVRTYNDLLTSYEKTEIYKFPEIYFVGKKRSKLTITNFDDKKSHYKISYGDHLAYRYEIVRKFGAGAFGQVIEAFDYKLKKMVAVKILINTEQMHEQGQIEAKLLSLLNSKHVPHVVEAYDYFVFRSHICITFEVLGKNLYDVLKADNFKPMSLRLVRSYAVQMFTALAAFAKLDMAHCDIKPENVAVELGRPDQVKVIDLGSACFVNEQIYEYIQSRYYRAPEVILGIKYGPAMDVWSACLVIIELLTGDPLFPGDSELEQLHLFIEYMGLPPRGLVQQGKRKNEFFTKSLQVKPYKGKTPKPNTRDVASLLKSTNDPYIADFVQKCLTWDQHLRMTAAQALRHPFLQMKQLQLNRRESESLPILKLHLDD